MDLIKKITEYEDYKTYQKQFKIHFNECVLGLSISQEMLYQHAYPDDYIVAVIADQIAQAVHKAASQQIKKQLEIQTGPKVINHHTGYLNHDSILSEDFNVDDKNTANNAVSGHSKVVEMFDKHLSHIQDKTLTCPTCGISTKVMYMLVHLNDEHDWKREDIADWLESTDLDLEFKNYDKK